MGNNSSRVAPTRSVRILDSHTRARYQNQRELNLFRRKLVDITTEHGQALAYIAANRHEARTTWQEIHHEIKRRDLAKKTEKRSNQHSRVSFQDSDVSDQNKLISPSLLMHDLNASNTWERSTVFNNNYEESMIDRSKPLQNLDSFLIRYPSKIDGSSPLFERSESTLSNKNLTLKQETERMKKSVRIAVAKSTRDFNIAARRVSLRH